MELTFHFLCVYNSQHTHTRVYWRMKRFISQPWFAALIVALLVVVAPSQAQPPFASGSGVTPCYDGDLLLANSESSYYDGDYFYGGRVELCYNGTYRPICSADDQWTDNDAAVVCNYIGYGSPYYREYYSYFVS